MDAKGHKWSNLEHDIPALSTVVQLSKYTDVRINRKKKHNKWKEGGCTWVDRLAGDWEETGPLLCLVCKCVRLHCVHIRGYAWYCTVVLHMCIENVTDFLVVCLKATDLLLAIDSECCTRSIFFRRMEWVLCCKQASKSINKEHERLAEKQQWSRKPQRTLQASTTTKTMLETKAKIHFSHSKRIPKRNTCLINYCIINWMLAYKPHASTNTIIWIR